MRLTETARLDALYRREVLDSEPESSFDELTKIAALACHTPIALVSLVDRDRQWFKARVGIDACETPRSWSFCSIAIETPGKMLVVENALEDERFRENPMVTGPPGIRAYAGAPVFSEEDHALGTLCVIDTAPRVFTANELTLLASLAKQVERNLVLRDVARQLHESRADITLRYMSLADFSQIVSHDLREPIRSIGLVTDWLADSLQQEDGAASLQHLDALRQRAARLERMVRDLAEYCAQGREMEPEDVDLRSAVVACVAERSDAAQIRLKLGLLPALHTLRTALEVIIRNVVSNAVRHSDQAVTVLTVGSRIDAIGLHVDFSDDGPGIPESQREAVFRPFASLQSLEAQRGTGMGLTIARRAATVLGGSLQVLAQGGRGATLRLTLPLESVVGPPT